MDSPCAYTIDSTLSIGVIYKFEAPDLIDTDIPHFFIVVAVDAPDNYLVLCTTQLENKTKYFDKRKLDYSSLVYIKPDSLNKFKKDTYVNCNDYYTITTPVLKNKLESGSLSYIGNISLNHYLQIKNGIIQSPINDLPEYLLIHPEE